MSGDDKKLNPQIAGLEIGTRSLRKIKVYPLSIADQLKMSALLTGALRTFVDTGNEMDYEFVKSVVDLITENIMEFLNYIVDEPEKVYEELSNDQLVDLANIVWEKNYNSTTKKVMSLLTQAGLIQPSRPVKQSQPSVKDTEDIDSTISSEEASETEE